MPFPVQYSCSDCLVIDIVPFVSVNVYPCDQVFPIVIYFSAVINIFYYWGLMQMVVSGIAWLMQFTMETTAIESLNAACNIFVGMVRPN